MKNLFLSLILFVCIPAIAQETVYQAFETDSAAQPRGDISYLNTFLQTNLRKPILAESKGTGGRVVVSGIVETDGHVTDVKAVQSKTPELDREAVRAFRLFNAWQPAQKGGKVVRQYVMIPVTFKANAPFSYVNGARVTYYDQDRKPLADSSEKALYKQLTPLDTNGIPNGDVVVYQRKRQEWKEYHRLAFVRKKSGAHSYEIGIQQADEQWQGRVFRVDDAGNPVRQLFYENGRQTGYELAYHANGSVAQLTEETQTRQTFRSWYQNGQIKQIWLVEKKSLSTPERREQVAALWESTGQPLIQGGNGRAVYRENTRSLSDTTRQTQFVEEGFYKNGYKQGLWTGRYADGSYMYEERFEQGICQGGKARTADGDTIRYTVRDQQPEFTGGSEGLGQFLAQNLRYPADAQRAGVQGKVIVNFVVCADGTLCDYKVFKSVNPSVDEEAVRVVKAMSGRWQPGVQRGKKVRVKYNLPINFTLE